MPSPPRSLGRCRAVAASGASGAAGFFFLPGAWGGGGFSKLEQFKVNIGAQKFKVMLGRVTFVSVLARFRGDSVLFEACRGQSHRFGVPKLLPLDTPKALRLSSLSV